MQTVEPDTTESGSLKATSPCWLCRFEPAVEDIVVQRHPSEQTGLLHPHMVMHTVDNTSTPPHASIPKLRVSQAWNTCLRLSRLKRVKRRKRRISASPSNWHVQTAKSAEIPCLQYARDKDAHINGVHDNRPETAWIA